MRFDTLIVGAGPAGLAAARAAKAAGKKTLVIDDNFGPGGQIWRGREGLHVDGVEMRFGTQVTRMDVEAAQVILATGAREVFVPFPGWTLPHVVGAGGLQALVKQGLNVAGKRVVVAGSGPLLLAVAANLSKAGAEVVMVAEQAPWGKLVKFGLGLWQWPGKIVEAMQMATAKYRAGVWPVKAEPGAVEMSNGQRVECDYVACGFGLVANVELAVVAGCAVDGGFVRVNRHMQTTVQGIYAVGELTGIGGVEKAEAEGTAAGAGKAVKEDYRDFVAALAETFALRAELRELVTDETIVCRCEDVTWARVKDCKSRREAKLHARCGMGPCQGKVCGPGMNLLKGWPADTVRPPVCPVTVGELIKS